MSHLETYRVELELCYNGEVKTIRHLPKDVKLEDIREIYWLRPDGERVLLKPSNINFDSNDA